MTALDTTGLCAILRFEAYRKGMVINMSKSKLAVLLRHLVVRVSPRLHLIYRNYKAFHHIPNLRNPQLYSEKIACRILFDHDPIYTKCADKIAVRDYVANAIPNSQELFPNWYGTWKNVEDIDFASLPDSFVLKSNHASGQIILCPDKNKLDIKKTKEELKKWLKVNWYYEYGEWQYKNIVPQIICEELLDFNITDYRIFCFEGEPYFIRATVHDATAATGYGVGVYDTKWGKFSLWQDNDNVINVKRPESLEQMVEIAKALSKDFHFVRVDLYDVGGKPYFSELTFTPNGGVYAFKPDDWDLKLGQMIKSDLKQR